MFDNQGHLFIFESFRVDRKLRKFTLKKESKTAHRIVMPNEAFPNDSDEDSGTEEMFVNAGNMVRGIMINHNGFVGVVKQSRPRWYEKFFFWRKEEIPDDFVEPVMSVENFFRSVKDGVEQLKIVAERASGYADAIKKAHAAGQVALEEQLSKGLVAVRAETQLAAMGLGKYVTEETVVAFAKKASKAVRLDWIANFTRFIPDDLLDKKREADERLIFDNYVVMHYDPKGKSWSETEAEKERRKDPILFGVIDGRRQLYYVGDWTDEFCDLTLDQIADTLGREVVKTV